MSLTSAMRMLMAQLSRRVLTSTIPLLFLMLIGAFAEFAMIGTMGPFLAAATGQVDSQILEPVTSRLSSVGIGGQWNIIHIVAALFATTVFLAMIIRLSLLWLVQRFVFGVSYELSIAVYARTLHQPYLYHTQQNSSEVIATITKVQNIAHECLMPLMDAIVGSVMVAIIFCGLIMVDQIVVPAAIGFAVIYIGVMLATRRSFQRDSEILARSEVRRIQAMQEGLGGIRDVILARSQEVFVETFEREESAYRNARRRTSFMVSAPKFLVEGLTLIAISLLVALAVGRAGALTNAIPILGTLALGAQRLLPLVQQLYMGWARAHANRQNLIDLARLFQDMRLREDKNDNDSPLPFQRDITLSGVSHFYPANRGHALRNVNITIRKGAKIGIAGETGGGKSTLLDILLGLIEPTEGTVAIDDNRLTSDNVRAWQRNVAHVPQFIFLADSSVAENIAFGVRKDEIDMARVRRAAAQANLSDFIATLPSGYDTRVGERGIQFSGGQRQRIGIARAFYQRSNVMVFDEATSALDTETEEAIMDSTAKLGSEVTVLMVAHRLSTLRGCDEIVWLKDGHIEALMSGDAISEELSAVGHSGEPHKESFAESPRVSRP